jgi:hypothetical protein
MTSKVLIDTLSKLAGAEHHGEHVRLSRDADTTLFIAIGNETLTVERVTALECKHDVVVATTHRGEQWAVAYEDIRALRVGAPGNKTALVG